jgi:hypothetical protein
MPKRIKKLKPIWIEPELRRCVEKAGHAAGENSTLTDGEILLLARLAWDGKGILFYKPAPGEEMGIEPSPAYYYENARKLVRLVAREPANVARAILAADKEAERIRATPLWMTRSTIRWMAFVDTIPVGKKVPFDIQSISEAVKKSHGIIVSEKLIHKAIKLEREVQSHQIPDGL